MAGVIKPKLTLDDFNGNQEKLAKGQQILDTTWDRANPAGTLSQNFVQPKITFADTGGVGEWGEYARAINNAYDNANRVNGQKGTQKGANEVLATNIANGTLPGSQIADNYAALAAGKMDELQNMGSFSYDFNKDPMFKILSQSYMQQAKQAANNASAMAAARTGGYGNSYGAAAASQQYNAALGNLYDQVPELQEAAYNKYLNERNDLYKQAGYYNDLNDTYYGRDFQEREAQREQGNLDRDYDFKKTEADREDSRWNKQFDYKAQQDALDRAEEGAQYLASLGYYDAAEQLYGVDLSVANETDLLKKALTIISGTGMDNEQAMTFLQKYLGIGGLEGIFGSGSGGGGGGGNKGGGSYSYPGTDTPATEKPVTTQQPPQTSEPVVYDVTDLWDQYYKRR